MKVTQQIYSLSNSFPRYYMKHKQLKDMKMCHSCCLTHWQELKANHHGTLGDEGLETTKTTSSEQVRIVATVPFWLVSPPTYKRVGNTITVPVFRLRGNSNDTCAFRFLFSFLSPAIWSLETLTPTGEFSFRWPSADANLSAVIYGW